MKRRLALLAVLAAAQLWCGDDDASPPGTHPLDGGTDAPRPPIDATAAEDSGFPPVPTCTDAFCRVAFPATETIALDGLWAKSPSEVWLVGSHGYAARFDGTSWRQIPTSTKARLFGVAGSSDGTVWAVSGGNEFFVLNRQADGGAESIDAGFKGIVTAVSTAGTEAYAVGTTTDLTVFPPPADNIWRFDGQWRAVSPPCPAGDFGPECLKLRAVWAESTARQWFAGDDGKIFRTVPTDAGGERLELAEMNSSSLRRLNGLWGFNGNDVWAVGAQGVIRHFTGGDAWTAVPSPVSDDLHAIWGSRPDDLWAVGDRGVVLHWDGERWSLVETPYAKENRPRLLAVYGTGNDVWIAGEGTLLRTNAGGDR